MSHPTVFLLFAAEILQTHPSSKPPKELEFQKLWMLKCLFTLFHITSPSFKDFSTQGHGSIFSLRASSCNQKGCKMCGMSGP